MRGLLDLFLRRFIVVGRLTVQWPDGELVNYSGQDGAAAAFRIRDLGSIRRIVVNPDLAVGECYMNGGLEPIDCSIYDVLCVLIANQKRNSHAAPMLALRQTFARLTRRLAQFNSTTRAQRNVAHHYDLNGRLYALFLDRDRQYSCAYFAHGDETLEDAQAAKKRHIAAKLCLNRPDLTVLDIGCGWGGTALTLARDYGARVTGITLSTEQLAEARARAAAEGLSDRVSFELLDYRDIKDRFDRPFDRIVSIGMFEHVGVGNFDDFFDVIKTNLAPDGVALLHAIGRFGPPDATSPWITKYIFPGGYCPALSEVLASIERSALLPTDMEILRLHYAETLRHWRRRFAANRDAIATIYDERFCRMFEFYLAGSEAAFRCEYQMVFQIQLTRDQTAAPLTRDYIHAAESIPGRVPASAAE